MAVFDVVWNYLIPVFLFVFCYWQIINVIRRRAKINPARRVPAPSSAAGASSSHISEVHPSTSGAVESKVEMTPSEIDDQSNSNKMSASKSIAVAGHGHNRQSQHPTGMSASQFVKVKGQSGQLHNKTVPKSQQKVIITMIMVTANFAILWLPIQVILILQTFSV